MEASIYGNAQTPKLPKTPKAKAKKFRSLWLVVGLILLSAIPLISGGFRLNQLANGAEITPENARFFASPLPVVIHIVSVSFYAILGAFQFVPSLRQRRNRWHRIVGWFLIPCGLIVALSGLWMTLFYPWPKGDGVIVYGERLLFGSGMLLSILLGIAAIQRRNYAQHGDWMLRGYALGMGAGTQVLTGIIAAIFVDPPTELSRAILMGAGWVINLALAEWIIRRRTVRPARMASRHAHTASAVPSDCNERNRIEASLIKPVRRREIVTMKWFRRIFIVLITLVGGLVGYVLFTVLRTERPVGFQIMRATDTDGHPFAVGIWYPTQAQPWPTTLLGTVLMNVARNASVAGQDLPLVVFSHGNGGGPASHADLALALANAGYIVAAPMHSGDNYADQSAFGSVSWLHRRTSELHATIDYMLTQWQGHDRINFERIGAFGFSAGGFTVLTAVGAQPDLRIIASRCAEQPEFVCKLLSQVKSPLLNANTPTLGDAFLPDARIKAAVVAAPGFGFTLVPNGLEPIRVPIQLWGADNDSNVPYATNTKLVREALGSRVEFHSVADAGHFSFLTPCGLLAPPALCSDQQGFDRKAFHMEMNASVIAFFEKHLNAEIY